MAHVAFIGLGRMGHGMAGRYVDAGFSVAVWNRSRAKAEDLIARGARWAASPADAAVGADAIVTMVADDKASRAVWLGKEGAAATAKTGTLAIECSTVSYGHALDLARELRGRGLVYIDSPVTGLPDAAAAGNLAARRYRPESEAGDGGAGPFPPDGEGRAPVGPPDRARSDRHG
jgi:3-hydroxyisobutyrate dehydrogenase